MVNAEDSELKSLVSSDTLNEFKKVSEKKKRIDIGAPRRNPRGLHGTNFLFSPIVFFFF